MWSWILPHKSKRELEEPLTMVIDIINKILLQHPPVLLRQHAIRTIHRLEAPNKVLHLVVGINALSPEPSCNQILERECICTYAWTVDFCHQF
jgi:hypothetical protein